MLVTQSCVFISLWCETTPAQKNEARLMSVGTQLNQYPQQLDARSAWRAAHSPRGLRREEDSDHQRRSPHRKRRRHPSVFRRWGCYRSSVHGKQHYRWAWRQLSPASRTAFSAWGSWPRGPAGGRWRYILLRRNGDCQIQYGLSLLRTRSKTPPVPHPHPGNHHSHLPSFPRVRELSHPLRGHRRWPGTSPLVGSSTRGFGWETPGVCHPDCDTR